MTSTEISGWRTSTRTSATQTCVEVGGAPGFAGVRDTKDREGSALTVTRARWSSFITAIKTGRYER